MGLKLIVDAIVANGWVSGRGQRARKGGTGKAQPGELPVFLGGAKDDNSGYVAALIVVGGSRGCLCSSIVQLKQILLAPLARLR
jgi:hypothetical protein